MTVATLSNQKMTVRLSYYLQRITVNDEKYIKNIHNSLSMEAEIMQRKMVSTVMY